MSFDTNPFDIIFKDKIKREGAEKLLSWLHTTDFYSAPASTRYHNANIGGLVAHSLNVYSALVRRLEQDTQASYSQETVAIVALLHDVCKISYYELRANGSYVVNDRFPCGDHAEKSIFIIQQSMLLTVEEIQAIRAHMGGWDSAARGGSSIISRIFGANRLAVHLHLSDMEATYLMDSREYT